MTTAVIAPIIAGLVAVTTGVLTPHGVKSAIIEVVAELAALSDTEPEEADVSGST